MHRRSRQIVIGLLLAVWAVLAAGVPVAVVTRRAGDEIYPCMDCPCGCVSAAVCWDRCCCMSDTQKIAWAKQNGVSPPQFLIDRVKKSAKPPACRCCCKKSKSLSERRTSKSPSERRTSKSLSERRTPVTALQAAQCRGIDMLWQTLTTGMLPAAPPQTRIDLIIHTPPPPHRGVAHTDSSVDPPVPLV